ncbi:hypothetical protein IMX07_06905 [bacterium]|nr:hypothetical protein [bacterium]
MSTANQRHNFQTILYLDENLCDCKKILEILEKHGFPYERHLKHFARGTVDEEWFPLPASNGWAVLTKDKALRYSPLERDQIIRHGLKIFAYSSGNMAAAEMAALLERHLRKIDRVARAWPPPFVAAIRSTGINRRTL